MKVEVRLKNIYGKRVFYPLSVDAISLTKLLSRPTLTIDQLKVCKEAGWDVMISAEQFSLDDFIGKQND